MSRPSNQVSRRRHAEIVSLSVEGPVPVAGPSYDGRAYGPDLSESRRCVCVARESIAGDVAQRHPSASFHASAWLAPPCLDATGPYPGLTGAAEDGARFAHRIKTGPAAAHTHFSMPRTEVEAASFRPPAASGRRLASLPFATDAGGYAGTTRRPLSCAASLNTPFLDASRSHNPPGSECARSPASSRQAERRRLRSMRAPGRPSCVTVTLSAGINRRLQRSYVEDEGQLRQAAAFRDLHQSLRERRDVVGCGFAFAHVNAGLVEAFVGSSSWANSNQSACGMQIASLRKTGVKKSSFAARENSSASLRSTHTRRRPRPTCATLPATPRAQSTNGSPGAATLPLRSLWLCSARSPAAAIERRAACPSCHRSPCCCENSTFPAPSQDNPGGKYETLIPSSLEPAFDLFGHLLLTAKAAPSRGGGCSPDLISIAPAALESFAFHDGERQTAPRVDVDVRAYAGKSKKGEAKGKDCNAPDLAARAVIYPARRGASHRAPQFSSGDRLGIHQPRSMVHVTKRRQGRARDRVKGPAVARFNSKYSRRSA